MKSIRFIDFQWLFCGPAVHCICFYHWLYGLEKSCLLLQRQVHRWQLRYYCTGNHRKLQFNVKSYEDLQPSRLIGIRERISSLHRTLTYHTDKSAIYSSYEYVSSFFSTFCGSKKHGRKGSFWSSAVNSMVSFRACAFQGLFSTTTHKRRAKWMEVAGRYLTQKMWNGAFQFGGASWHTFEQKEGLQNLKNLLTARASESHALRGQELSLIQRQPPRWLWSCIFSAMFSRIEELMFQALKISFRESTAKTNMIFNVAIVGQRVRRMKSLPRVEQAQKRKINLF